MNLTNIILVTTLVSALSIPGQAQTKKSTSTKKPAATAEKSDSKKQSRSVSSSASAAQTQSATVRTRKPMVNSSLSEYAFQPAAGHQAVSARTVYQNRKVDYVIKNRGVQTKDYETSKGFVLMTRYDRGLENGWGFAAEIGTTVAPQETSRKGQNDGRQKGFTDITLTGRNHKAIRVGELTYGGQVSISPNEREIPTNRDDGNMQTGGHSIAGFVGVQKETQRYVVGGEFKHRMFMDRSSSVKIDNRTISTTISNGNTFDLQGYMEMPYEAQLFGASAGLLHTLPTDFTSRVSGGNKSNYDIDAYNIIKLAAYGNFRVSSMKNLEILPQIGYQKVLSDSGGALSVTDGSEESVISIGARLSL